MVEKAELERLKRIYDEGSPMLSMIDPVYDKEIDLQINKISFAAGMVARSVMGGMGYGHPGQKVLLNPSHISYITGISEGRILEVVKNYYQILYPKNPMATYLEVEGDNLCMVTGVASLANRDFNNHVADAKFSIENGSDGKQKMKGNIKMKCGKKIKLE
jgi:hypothetical protein